MKRKNTIGKWESGTSEPKASRIAEMANLFGISVEKLMGFSEVMA